MHREKGDTAEVCSFAAKKGAKWPVFDKVLVNGEGASPVYSFVKASSGNVADVEWNFGACPRYGYRGTLALC
jgi:glutathione peroxidase